MKRALICAALVSLSCASAPQKSGERDQWASLMNQYSRIEAVRNAPTPVPRTRRDQIAGMVSLQDRVEPLWIPFMNHLEDYYQVSHDPRAAQVWVREKLILGDYYAQLLARYDKAIEVYLSALELDPENPAVIDRIESARERAYIRPATFNSISTGMREGDVVARVGYPRVDWVRQVIRSGRTYQAWIYPRSDGGAAAIYFEDGTVYHKNWQAAPAQGGGGR